MVKFQNSNKGTQRHRPKDTVLTDTEKVQRISAQVTLILVLALGSILEGSQAGRQPARISASRE
jgi:hypothetical protein